MDIFQFILLTTQCGNRLLTKREHGKTRMTIVYRTNESKSILVTDEEMKDGPKVVERLGKCHQDLMNSL